jgi:protein-disulfide isomerase
VGGTSCATRAEPVGRFVTSAQAPPSRRAKLATVKLACSSLVLLAVVACAGEPPVPLAPIVTLPVATATTAPVTPPPSPPVATEAPLDLPGVDTQGLDAREHAQWAALVRQLMAPCPAVAVPLAQCVQEGRDCRKCAPAARWVAHAVHALASDEAVRTAYAARYDPSRVVSLPLDGSPAKGPADAQVTVVEFADLECPACRAAQPAVDAVLAAHAGNVRLVLKLYPIATHPHAEAAAHAALAAGRQGKFWEMEHALLKGQEHLEPGDIEGYARKLGLDMTRFRADLNAPDIAAKVGRDRQLGDAVKVNGTPTLFVDGRMLGDGDELEDRVRDELDGL